MGRWTRQEIEEAFEHYQKAALEAGKTGDWNGWADCFTEDCTFVEHCLGTFGGREAIRKFWNEYMSKYPACEVKYFPVEWYIIDEERGWVVCQFWNRMSDPGDGSLHQSANFSLLKYAGNGKWNYEEDAYNIRTMAKMVKSWEQAKERLALAQSRNSSSST